MMKNVWRQKCHITRKIRDPLYTTFQKIFTIIRIFLKNEAPKALYSSHSFIVSALIIGLHIGKYPENILRPLYLEGGPCNYTGAPGGDFRGIKLINLTLWSSFASSRFAGRWGRSLPGDAHSPALQPDVTAGGRAEVSERNINIGNMMYGGAWTAVLCA